jgi:hypothetical protein
MRDCGIHTTATPRQIREAFRAAFTERPPAKAMIDPHQIRNARWQRRLVWEEIELEGADMAVALVRTPPVETFYEYEDTNPSHIAMRIQDNGNFRMAYIWQPQYKKWLYALLDGFGGTFKAYSRIIFENIHRLDETAELMRV